MKHFQENANEISSLLEQNLYVDNVLASFQSEETAMKFYKESRTLLAAGGFNLRSWSSNSEKLQNLSKAEKTADGDSVVKVLGMKWNPQEDTLQYAKNDTGQKKDRVTTKREVLRETSKVFDPLGLLSPISVKAKIFMQELWKANLKWDEKLHKSMQTTWREFSSEICDALGSRINRNNSSSIDSRCDSLHVFYDASQQAYGACVYLLSINKITLLMAKNRVTPIKQITLPRLELMGALIGARFGKHVKEITGVNKIYFWCDSQIVLHWIISQKTPNRFVANRVNKFRDISKSSTWQYCPTYCNPADYLTRGIALKKFKEDTLWWNGPEWLMEPNKWPVWDGPTKAILCSTSTEEESDTLRTVVTEIEAMLNDRPLTYISSDPEDLQPLTPSQLLYGRRLTSLPYFDEEDTNNHSLLNHEKANEFMKQQNQLLQNFWNRWKTEYLTSLRQYHCRTGTTCNKIKIGDVVQVHDDFTKRINWKIALVVDLTTGRDGLTRSALLRLSNGTITNRPITKLYPLEVCESKPELRRSQRLSN